MERQPDRQGNVQHFLRVRPPEMLRKGDQVRAAEVQILENEEHQTGGDNTDHQTGFLLRDFVLPFLDENTSGVIYRNGYQEDKNILRDKPHIEEAAGGEQHEPAPFMRQQIEQQRDYREENQKFYRVEEHSVGVYSGGKDNLFCGTRERCK
jgi:hypothetical protein